ncbi:hypothetical protein [Phaeacidiphilus oryzae]|nr:hypothetical protein [Phaeacidiphilus oryzae]
MKPSVTYLARYALGTAVLHPQAARALFAAALVALAVGIALYASDRERR